MKKVLYSFLWLFTVGGFLFLTSCGDDTEDPADSISIALNPSDTSAVVPGDTVTIGVTVTGSDEDATVVSDMGGDFLPDNIVASGEDVQFVVPESAGGDMITLTFSVTDGNAQQSEQLSFSVGFETVVGVASSSTDFSILVQALTQANLVTTLQGDGPFTVFAPTNAAFEALTADLGITTNDLLARDDLADILQYHVVSGRVLSTDLQPGPVVTLEGSNAFITTDGGAQVNGATIDPADLVAGNGVVHVVDQVLLPQSSIITSTAVLLGGQLNSTLGSFYNVLDDTVYTSAAAQMNGNDVDLLYWFTEASGSIIGAPDNQFANDAFENTDFTTIQNSTRFRTTTVTAAQFDGAMSQSALEDLIGGDFDGSEESRLTSLTEGDVFSFMLDAERGGNEGLAKVVEISGQVGNERQITLDIKTIR
ncbi:fasciclin domain-containing protein [Tunicatimonas pelagia]|uniref:fasciclin domain-containing protein n=1 Tax=Tunicatimonas pelagia TaxID=931531 RepID=UPI002664E89D|nr:fasciclin domain-containing protein [Tunicatimonas pelagia]WKN40731.1 fasciclin domain-containing protein [Tunicatimonas pelagia]